MGLVKYTISENSDQFLIESHVKYIDFFIKAVLRVWMHIWKFMIFLLMELQIIWLNFEALRFMIQ